MGFKTANSIKLQPYDWAYEVKFKFPNDSSATSYDGTIPYGTNINTAIVTGWYGDTLVTDLFADDTTISGSDIVIVSLKYPETTMSGINRVVNMRLKFILTLDSEEVVQDYFRNLYVGDNQ